MDNQDEYCVVFFGGGETRNDRFNIFTGSIIGFLTQIFGDRFNLIKGIYFRFPMLNVIWALNNAQKPIHNPQKNRITAAAYKQIISEINRGSSTLIIISSSSGGVVAAQTACFLSEQIKESNSFTKPFHLAIGTSLISKKSELYRKLLEYQKMGIIDTLIFDDLHDTDDSINEAGGTSRREAYSNAFGLILPVFSSKFRGPSFLNTDPVNGHFHRKRSKTKQKAVDFIKVIFIKHRLGGNYYCNRSLEILESAVEEQAGTS